MIAAPWRRRLTTTETGRAPMPYAVLGERDLTYDDIERRQVWVLTPPSSLDDPLLGYIAHGILRDVLRDHPRLRALSVVFYRDLDADAVIGSYEWAPLGVWNAVEDVGPGSFSTHRWTRVYFDDSIFINYLNGLPRS